MYHSPSFRISHAVGSIDRWPRSVRMPTSSTTVSTLKCVRCQKRMKCSSRMRPLTNRNRCGHGKYHQYYQRIRKSIPIPSCTWAVAPVSVLLTFRMFLRKLSRLFHRRNRPDRHSCRRPGRWPAPRAKTHWHRWRVSMTTRWSKTTTMARWRTSWNWTSKAPGNELYDDARWDDGARISIAQAMIWINHKRVCVGDNWVWHNRSRTAAMKVNWSSYFSLWHFCEFFFLFYQKAPSSSHL